MTATHVCVPDLNEFKLLAFYVVMEHDDARVDQFYLSDEEED